jgi:hypothetical protein
MPALDDDQRLKTAFARAAEIAAGVPEAMQDAAFNRALDQILGVDSTPLLVEGGGRQSAKTRTPRRKAAEKQSSAVDESPATGLISQIDRTAYPEIFQAATVLDRALRLLRLAEEDFDVEFLSAPEIAQVLREKFRLPTTHQAVRQALATTPQYVDTQQVRRGSRGRSVLAYRIMSPGTNFLDAGGTSVEPESTRPTRRRNSGGKRRPVSTKRKAGAKRNLGATRRKVADRRQPTGEASGSSSGQTRSARSSSPSPTRTRRGPKTALGELIVEGFFDEPRTIGDAKDRLRHKKGLTFTLQDLSPSLVRLLREGSLDREQNEAGQYEYRRP